MINVKSQVYKALCNVCENTADAYPAQDPDFPFIYYSEEQNNVYEWTDGREQKSQLRYLVTIWAEGSTSALALRVDEEIAKLGLRRTSCSDVAMDSDRRCKQMRYEGIIDVNDEQVYQNYI